MTTPESPYVLGPTGTSWWSWAWSTPQAERWDGGALYTAARRAALEDEWSSEPSPGLSREMRELETQLGLGPKAWAALGGKGDEKPKGGNTVDEFTRRRAERRARAAGAPDSDVS